MLFRSVLAVAPVLFPSVRAQDQHQSGAGAQSHDGAKGHEGMQHADHMEHSFADAERYAKSFDDPARDAWQMPDRVIAALGLKPGSSVADIGAGTGYFSVRLAKSAGKVFAADYNDDTIVWVDPKTNTGATAGFRCENCAFFRAPKACGIVKGSVDRAGVCRLYVISQDRLVKRPGVSGVPHKRLEASLHPPTTKA